MGPPTLFSKVIEDIQNIVGSLVPFLSGLALFYFVWGLVVYIAKSGSEEAQAEGKNKMVWGLIALFVIVSVWGLVKFIGNSFDIDVSGTAGAIPQF